MSSRQCRRPLAAKVVAVTAVMAAVLLLAAGGDSRCRAEEKGGPWTAPQNLSGSLTASQYPAIAADPSGAVHVLWAENTIPESGATEVIFYTRWDGGRWSAPVDVALSPGGVLHGTQRPAAVATRDGRLHLVWEGSWTGRIYYSTARADAAGSAQGWARPRELNVNDGVASYADIVAGADGALHVTWVVGEGDLQGVYHAQSSDGGTTWSEPICIPETQTEAGRLLESPRLAVDDRGVVHVTWLWQGEGGVLKGGNGILYAHSADSGRTWSQPLLVAEGPFGYPDIATVRPDDVLLFWAGTVEQRFRFSQWSSDGGLTWSPPLRQEEMGGYLDFSGAALDSAGVLHVAYSASDYRTSDDAILHMTWQHGSWSSPEQVMLDGSQNGDFQAVALAITEGNLVHLVADFPVDAPGQQGVAYNQIWYAQRRVDAPFVASMPLPTAPAVLAGHGLTPSPLPTAEPTKLATPAATRRSGDGAQPAGFPALAVGVASSALVLAGYVALSRLQRGRR